MKKSWIEKRDCEKSFKIKSYEEYDNGIDLDVITPFWRMVNPYTTLAGKLACGIDFISQRQMDENIVL